MKTLLLIFMITCFTYASSIKKSVELNYWYNNVDLDMSKNEPKKRVETNIANMQINLDYYSENLYIQSSLFGYMYDTDFGPEGITMPNYLEPIKKNDMFFRSHLVILHLLDIIEIISKTAKVYICLTIVF